MTKTPIWDAAFLKERERDAQEQANQAQFEADWEQADAQFGREFSDANNGFQLCPLRACLRARSSRTFQIQKRRPADHFQNH